MIAPTTITAMIEDIIAIMVALEAEPGLSVRVCTTVTVVVLYIVWADTYLSGGRVVVN